MVIKAVHHHVHCDIDGMGTDFTDVFNDGGVDFYCSDLPPDHLFQMWVPAIGRYVDATAAYGLQGGGVGWACNWLDYDNDGWQDLHVVQDGTNLLFRNPAQAAMAQIHWPDRATALGMDVPYHKFTAAIADFDNDGHLDVLQRYSVAPGGPQAPDGVTMHHNVVPGGNWLKFRVRGTVSNRDGLGARIEVLTGSHHQRQWVRNGVGFLSGSDRRVHFGLGTATVADLVVATWPSGQRQYLTNIAANQIVDLVEPRMTLQAPATVGGVTVIEASIPGDGGLPYLMALAFSEVPGVTLADGNHIPINPDVLAFYTLGAGNAVLPGSVGILTAGGQASSAFVVPPLPFLSGLTVYGTTMTIDFPLFPIVRTVFPRALPITIQ